MDVHIRGQQPAPNKIVTGLVDVAADRDASRIDLAFRQPQQCPARLGRAPLAGFTVGALGFGIVAAKAEQLGLLVAGHAERRLSSRRGKPFVGPPSLDHRLRPGAAQLQELGAMHQALAPVRSEIGLAVAPDAQRRRPLLGPRHVESVLTRLDHRAVTMPATMGETSPAVTATITSSSSARPSTGFLDAMRDCPRSNPPKARRSLSPKRSPVWSASAATAYAASASPLKRHRSPSGISR